MHVVFMELVEAKEYIDKEYEKLRMEGADRSQIYLNIIAFKRFFTLEEYVKPLYVDVKQWILFHFEDLTNKDFGYDVFSAEPFLEQIEFFPAEKSLRLYQFLQYACDENHVDSSEIKKRERKLQINLWLKNGNRFKAVCFLMANNFGFICASIILFIALVIVSFLPAPFEWMRWLDLHFLDWTPAESQQTFTGYLSNALFYIAHGETEIPMVTPRNPAGVLWVIAVECAFWGFLGNFLYQHISHYLSRIGLNREEEATG